MSRGDVPAPDPGPPAADPLDASESIAPSELTLLDGAGPPPHELDLAAQKRIAADTSLGVESRLEAYEDIIDSDVGDTALTRARNLERDVGLRQIYLKFEGGNPSGTQKDRIAFAQVKDALRRGFDALTVATCGNYGAALAPAAALAGLRCVIHIPRSYHTRRLEEMERAGAEIVLVEGDYERAVLESREIAERDEMYDANPGGANTALQLQAYGEIAYEIYDDLRDAPAAVAVAVSNGTTLAGIYRGFLSLFRRGRTSKMPRMIAGSAARKNPIVQAYLKNLPHCEDLDPQSIRETPVNEPLINWHSSDGEHALQAIRATGGWAGDASDREMLAQARNLRDKQGFNVLPASTASLEVLLERHRREPLGGDRYVVVLTGRKA
jgi:threonine synthase